MADKVEKVTIQLALQQLVTGPAALVTAALRNINNAGVALSNRLRGVFGGLAGPLLGLAGGFGIAELIRKATDLARQQEINSARLSVSLDGNLSRVKALQSAIDGVKKTSVYSQTDLTGVAEQLAERGVSFDKIPQSLQVIANTASALRLPLDEVGKQIAITFGGTVPRELGRAVPALKDLSEEALRAGGALDVLSRAYDGRATAFANTQPGKEAAALRDIEQAWTDIGKAILPIERTLLPGVAKAMKDLSQLADPTVRDALPQGASDTLSEKTGGVLTTGRIPGHTYFNPGGLLAGDLFTTEPGTETKPPNSAQKAADAYAKLQRAALDAEYKDALERANAVQTELGNISLHGTEDINKKQAAANAKAAEEEFKARTISLQKYLSLLSQAADAERGRIGGLIVDLNEQLPSNHAIQHLRDKVNTLSASGKTEAAETAQIQLTKELQKQLDIGNQLREQKQNLLDLDREAVDAQARAIDEALKQVPASAKAGLTDVQRGRLDPSQLRTQIAGQLDQIDIAIKQASITAEKVYPAGEAAALKARLTLSAQEVRETAEKEISGIRSVFEARQDASVRLQDATEKGLANSLTEVETKAKTAKQALLDLAQSFVKTMLDIINQRFAEQVVGAPAGGTKGGGLFGLIGGALISGVSGVAGGAIGGGAGDFSSGAGASSGGSFAFGGFTGTGQKSAVAGIVHKGEYVIPAEQTARYREVLQAIHRNATPEQITARMMPSSVGRAFRTASYRPISGAGDTSAALRGVQQAVNDLAEIHSRPISVGVPITGDTVRLLHNHPDSPKILADMMTNNPSIMKPTINRLSR